MHTFPRRGKNIRIPKNMQRKTGNNRNDETRLQRCVTSKNHLVELAQSKAKNPLRDGKRI